MDKLVWSTQKRKVKDLIPYEKNPRKISDEQMKQLKESLDRFNVVEIPAIDLDNKLIAGHQRVKALMILGRGEEEIDVRVPNRKLTREEFEEYNIRSNKNTGDWDNEILALFDEDLLEKLGFEDKELDRIFRKEIAEDDFNADEEVAKIDKPTSKYGDIYQLGKHRLMCGDSTKIEDVERLMNGKKADMVFTDPPYGVSYADKNKYLNTISRGNRIQTEIMNDHLSVSDIANDVIYPSFCNIKNILAEYGSYYITAPQGGELLMMMQMMQKAQIPLRHMIIWNKNNHVLGRTDYNYKHEPILYGWVDKHKFYGGGTQRFSVWDFNKPLKNDLHPTMKPVELIVNAILNSTQSQNNLVVDIFLGSGSTLIACEKTKRICYGMELDEKYVDVIIKRFSLLTGQKAIKLN